MNYFIHRLATSSSCARFLLLAGANPNDVAPARVHDDDDHDDGVGARSVITPIIAKFGTSLHVDHLRKSSLLAVAVHLWDRTMLRQLMDAGATLIPDHGQESLLMA